jgi:hypothetical protein
MLAKGSDAFERAGPGAAASPDIRSPDGDPRPI